MPGSGSLCCLGHLCSCCWGCWCSRGLSARGSGDQWGSVRGAHASTSPSSSGGHRPAGLLLACWEAACSSPTVLHLHHFTPREPEPPGSAQEAGTSELLWEAGRGLLRWAGARGEARGRSLRRGWMGCCRPAFSSGSPEEGRSQVWDGHLGYDDRKTYSWLRVRPVL